MFQIGEFARIAQVSTAQLRRYDKMGLLKPQKIDSFTGYRYYSATQIPRLNRILALKELGLTLKQIGRALDDNISSEELRGMLYMKKTQIEQMIYEEIARVRYIESRIDQIDTEGTLNEYDIVLKSVPATKFLSSRDKYESVMDVRANIGMSHQMIPKSTGKKLLGYFTAILHSDGFFEGEIDLEMGFQVDSGIDEDLSVELSQGIQFDVTELPAVEHILTITRIGDPQLGHGTYGALATWMEANNYQSDGPVRELFIQYDASDMGKMVAEVQYPVTPIVSDRPQLL